MYCKFNRCTNAARPDTWFCAFHLDFLSNRPTDKRVTLECLNCRRNFKSRDKVHNRICPNCKTTVDWKDGDDSFKLSVRSVSKVSE